MNAQQRGQSDGRQNRGMSIDPKWTPQEKQAYIAAYNGAKGRR